jgi:hypothetical protein
MPVCACCLKDDRTPKGRCRPCRDEIRHILAARTGCLPPCAVCGASERSPSGACRPCASERKRRQREREGSPEVVEALQRVAEIGEALFARLPK